MKLVKRLEMMQELKSIKENKQETETCNCGCENCQCNVEKEKTNILKQKIDWNNPETLEFIKNELISGKGYTEIARHLEIDNSTLRKKCISLGLNIYYEESVKIKANNKEFEKLEKQLRLYAHGNLQHTKKYLIDNFKKDHNFRTHKGIMLKEDFIEQYYETRKRSGTPTFKYDFSQLPDIITGRYEKVKIYVNEVSTKTNKVIGDWETCIREFIVLERENGSIAGMLAKNKTDQYIDNAEFMRRSKELFKDHAPGFDKLEYINQHIPVILKCNNCREYFSQKPCEHLHGTGYCPACAMKLCGEKKSLGNERFIELVTEVYGPDVWDFSKLNYVRSNKPITLIYKETGEECRHIPQYFLDSKDPRKSVVYKGESIIKNVLRNIGISEFETQKNIEKKELIKYGLDKSSRSRISADFFLEYNRTKYIIEYNGIQHYEYTPFLHRKNIEIFKRQVERDKLLKRYCTANNIVLIEIPYTLKTFNKIKPILEDVLKNRKSLNELIELPKVKEI